jgi:hypothetical protein
MKAVRAPAAVGAAPPFMVPRALPMPLQPNKEMP